MATATDPESFDRLVVGLGNPGPRYEGTRHNIGFAVVRALALRHRIAIDQQRFEGDFGGGWVAGRNVGMLLPGTFMNASGRAVAAALAAMETIDRGNGVLIVYDDLDLPFGRIRLRARGSAGGQRGMADVMEVLETREIPRLRFGVGRPEPADGARDYVLDAFSSDERAVLGDHVARANDAIEHFLAQGIEAAMDRFNGGLAPSGEVSPSVARGLAGWRK